MFLVRSAFWLVVAFIIVQPNGMDIGSAASAFSEQAVSAGRQVVADQINQTECTTIECAGGKLVLASAMESSPQVVQPMQDLPTAILVPVPRPRPDWAG